MTIDSSLQPLQVKLLDPRFGDEWPLPAYATEHSAGLDLRAALETELTLQPGDTALIPAASPSTSPTRTWPPWCCRAPGLAIATASCWATAPA